MQISGIGEVHSMSTIKLLYALKVLPGTIIDTANLMRHFSITSPVDRLEDDDWQWEADILGIHLSEGKVYRHRNQQ